MHSFYFVDWNEVIKYSNKHLFNREYLIFLWIFHRCASRQRISKFNLLFQCTLSLCAWWLCRVGGAQEVGVIPSVSYNRLYFYHSRNIWFRFVTDLTWKDWKFSKYIFFLLKSSETSKTQENQFFGWWPESRRGPMVPDSTNCKHIVILFFSL